MNPILQPETSITPQQLDQLLAAGRLAELIDVRTPGEFATARVPGAKSVPLDGLDAAEFMKKRGHADQPLYVLCQSGTRARKAVDRFQRAGFVGCVLIEGGTQAWIDAGLPVERAGGKVLPLMRQVQILVGFVSAIGAGLSLAVSSWFALVPLVLGAGLLFAGITGYCGLGMLLAKMPWNRGQIALPIHAARPEVEP